MKRILIIIFAITPVLLAAQNASIDFKTFSVFNQSKIGLSYANFMGEVSNFTKHGGAIDLDYAIGRGKNLYGFNMNLLMSDNKQDFTIPQGFEHYKNPGTLMVGLFYGQQIGESHKSHFQAAAGLNYAWLLHRKDGDDIGGYRGFVPRVEFSRSFRVGKPSFSEMRYTSQFTPMKYDPSISIRFIDVFVGYQHLLLNNDEGRGGLISIGIRYKTNRYSIKVNLESLLDAIKDMEDEKPEESDFPEIIRL